LIDHNSPGLLIIDDEPDQQVSAAAALRLSGLEVAVRLPTDLTEQDLLDADLIAIDQFYDWSKVPHPEEVAYWPADGLALAGIISRRLATLSSHAAVVLRTGDIDRLARNLPRSARVPLLSATFGLDWILEKGAGDTSVQIRELASAAAALRSFTDRPTDWNEGSDWLSLPLDRPWASSALAEVQVCRPPEHVVAEYTAGTAWLRWFAHRVLPFPSFLVSDLKAASILRMTISDFRSIVEGRDSRLSAIIGECAYTGHLAELAGRRWWRAGIESLLDELLLDAPFEATIEEVLEASFEHLHGTRVQILPAGNPVVTIDSDYAEVGISDASDCVRLAPDYWPVFADQPWAERSDVYDDAGLARMVSRGDRHLVGADQAQ
jgi:hypothetical protein